MLKQFDNLAATIARTTGHPFTFVGAAGLVGAWALSGPLFGYSETWQLVINTSTTIITFLIMFVIQNTQNRDGAAIQAKLDEIIRAGEAENAFVGIDRLSADDVEAFRVKCATAAIEKGK